MSFNYFPVGTNSPYALDYNMVQMAGMTNGMPGAMPYGAGMMPGMMPGMNNSTAPLPVGAPYASYTSGEKHDTGIKLGAIAALALTTVAVIFGCKNLGKSSKNIAKAEAAVEAGVKKEGFLYNLGRRFGKRKMNKQMEKDIEKAANDAKNYKYRDYESAALKNAPSGTAAEYNAKRHIQHATGNLFLNSTGPKALTNQIEKEAKAAAEKAEKAAKALAEETKAAKEAKEARIEEKVKMNLFRNNCKKQQVSSPIVSYESKATMDKAHAEKINEFYSRKTVNPYVEKYNHGQYTAKAVELQNTTAAKEVAKAEAAATRAEEVRNFYDNFGKTKGKVKEYSEAEYIANKAKLEKTTTQPKTEAAATVENTTTQPKAETTTTAKTESSYTKPTAEEKAAIKKNNAEANKAKALANQIQNHAKFSSLNATQRVRKQG